MVHIVRDMHFDRSELQAVYDFVCGALFDPNWSPPAPSPPPLPQDRRPLRSSTALPTLTFPMMRAFAPEPFYTVRVIDGVRMLLEHGNDPDPFGTHTEHGFEALNNGRVPFFDPPSQP